MRRRSAITRRDDGDEMMRSEPADFETARANMVNGQITPNQVSDRRVIMAMRALPREAFAPNSVLAYADAEVDLGDGRFMITPSLAARLAQLALSMNPAHVLIVGSGTGYLAAVLSECGPHVVALEENAHLTPIALATYAPAVESVIGRLAAGWPAAGPYDLIIIEGSIPEIPEDFAAQLAPNGSLVAILSNNPPVCRAVVARSQNGRFASVTAFDCAARPLPAFQAAPHFSL